MSKHRQPKPKSRGEQEEDDRTAGELQEKLARDRIGQLLAQAKALDRAKQIRTYVESAFLRATEMPTALADFDKWAMWARQEADRIDPVKNGTIARSIKGHSDAW